MKNRSRTLYRCPYCTRPHGVVGLDMFTVSRLCLKSNATIELDMLTSADLSPFVFSSDAAPNRPCAHLVYFYIDLFVNESSPPKKLRRMLDVSLNGTVVPLRHGKFGEDLGIWTWESLVDDKTSDVAMSTSYEVGEIRESFRIAAPTRQVSIQGTLIVAKCPDVFLVELQERYAQACTT